MNESVYARLAEALDKLPNGFPRTPSNVEILILKKIFSIEDAALASELTGAYEPVGILAQRLGLAEEELKTRLMDMAKQGLVWLTRKNSKLAFRLVPFIVGIYESNLEKMDHELAHLVEEYLENGGAEGIMKPQPALHRVIPVQGAVKSEWILPYDDISMMLEKAKSFRVRDCICRVQQDLLNSRKCDFPVRNCVTFSPVERSSHPDDITKEKAMAILDEAEQVGLVHCVSNVIQDIFYVCNCCGCCCGVLRGITDWGIEESIARANYHAEIDAGECTGCGICVNRCQVKAIVLKDETAVVDYDRCIGCGLCVTGCPVQAARLERVADAALVHPPDDFSAWERRRLEHRGLSGKK
jgi:electron transport complex protein RnfB